MNSAEGRPTRERQVAEITDSAYFRSLRDRAKDLRWTFEG